MKKPFTILLALILVLSLVGCNAAPADNAASNNQNGVLQGDSQKNNPDTQNNVSADTGKTQSSDTQSGDSGDISRDEAIHIALNHAKVNQDDAKNVTAEKDLDDQPVHYDVDFHAGGYEYDYEIAAATGKILKSQKEKEDDAKQSSSSSTTASVTRETAKKAALKHAKVAEKDAKYLKVERDDDGYFEVSFDAGGYEYDYKISAKTGKILKWEKEKDDDVQTAAPSTISKTEAKNVALKHAGVSAANARDLEVELDDDGYYEVTFENSGYEYEYKISAKTGKIILSEKERND